MKATERDLEKYRAESEKLDTTYTLPVSQEFKARIGRAKSAQIDVNRWARDVLRRNWFEVERLIASSDLADQTEAG